MGGGAGLFASWRAALCALCLALGACGRLDVDAVYALRLAAPPGDGAWDQALPRVVKVGGGSVHGRPPALAGLDVDTDAVHGAAASCHHGPPVTHPTPVEIRSYYTDKDLFVDVRWSDSTEDRAPRSWRRVAGGWEIGGDDEDGLAILWSAGGGRFACQEACHQSDFAVRGGSLVDVRSMYLAEEGAREEAWVWKPSLGARDLIIDRSGFKTVEGAPYATVNSRAAGDETLGPEARRAAIFGKGDAPLLDRDGGTVGASTTSAPAYRWAPGGRGSGLAARAVRQGRRWRVVFSRPLDAGPGRQNFRPGQGYRFGIAVFDGTSVNHHVVRDAQRFEVVAPRRLAESPENAE